MKGVRHYSFTMACTRIYAALFSCVYGVFGTIRHKQTGRCFDLMSRWQMVWWICRSCPKDCFWCSLKCRSKRKRNCAKNILKERSFSFLFRWTGSVNGIIGKDVANTISFHQQNTVCGAGRFLNASVISAQKNYTAH